MDEALPALLGGGRFSLVEPIGRGASAEVWKAFDHEQLVFRAIKLLDPDRDGDRFETRARALARVRHPRVVRVHEVGRNGPWRWAVLDLCATTAASVDLRLAFDVLDGLAAIHDAGLAHGDLDLDEILVDDWGGVRIADLGPGPATPADDLGVVARWVGLPGPYADARALAVDVARAAGAPHWLAPARDPGRKLVLAALATVVATALLAAAAVR